MLIKLDGISKTYGRTPNAAKALDNISLQIEKGEIVSITGKSGSGKSTLLNIIGGIDKPDEGSYFFEDKQIQYGSAELAEFRSNNIGFVVQNFALLNDLTSYDNIMLALKLRKSSNKENTDRINVLAERLGIKSKLECYPNQLSGGECQRVAIARALVSNPKVILADEPTGALDSQNGAALMDLLKKINHGEFNNGEKVTILIVTHDVSIADMCDRMMRLHDGKIV